MENVGERNCGNGRTLRKTPKMLALSTTIVPLATPRLKLRTVVGSEEWSNNLYARLVSV